MGSFSILSTFHICFNMIMTFIFAHPQSVFLIKKLGKQFSKIEKGPPPPLINKIIWSPNFKQDQNFKMLFQSASTVKSSIIFLFFGEATLISVLLWDHSFSFPSLRLFGDIFMALLILLKLIFFHSSI